MSKSKQIAEWKEKKFGRFITEEELVKRCDPLWPYRGYVPPNPYIEPEIIDRVMKGSIELHTHGNPTVFYTDGRAHYFDTAIECSEAGMAAIVFKDQDTQTCAVAGVLQKGLDALAAEKAKHGEEFKPLQVFGGLVLDYTTGGMNLLAVKKALAFGRCKEIWLPAWDSAHMQEIFGDETKGIRVSDMSGTLTPEMIGVLEMLHDYNTNSTGERCCLATCHVSNEEKYDVAKYVKDKGMNVGVVHDHITQELTANTLEEAIELIDLGSYVEICSNSVVPWSGMQNWIVAYDYMVELTKRLIKARGPEHVVLVTDAGVPYIYEVPALRELIRTLLQNGISEADVNVMLKDAPAALIGKI